MKGYWCYKVLPLVYDGSLSYYEVLCKIVRYINGLIEDMKASGEQISEMKEEVAILQREVERLEGRVDSVEGSVSDIGGQCDTLEEGLRRVGVALTGVFSRLDDVESNVVALNVKVPFAFGVDENGNYGYYKEGADTVTPFNSGGGDVKHIEQFTISENIIGRFEISEVS